MLADRPPLIAGEPVGLSERAPHGPQLVVEHPAQAAARVQNQGGGVGHHPLGGEVAHDLIAVELHIAGGATDPRSVISTRAPRLEPATPGQPARTAPLAARRRATLWKGRA